ncbi:MAG: macro domain-containing protein [Kiloniellales bacterium]|nr:macro domain-containing protein [Kiloniellales bacterium]
MPLIPSRGDLFATPGLQGLGHGCNCAGSMGKGIAVAFRERWPEMYAAYKERCRDGRFGLGDVFLWEEDGVCVFNLGTQKSWRSRAELPAIRRAVAETLRLAEARGLAEVALPRIGAGLGGLDWDEVRSLLEELTAESPVRLLVCEDHVPGAPLRPLGAEPQADSSG